MKFFYKVDLGLLFSSFLLCFQVEAAPSKPVKPNIIFFLVDDMGWQETSFPFHPAINDVFRTMIRLIVLILNLYSIKYFGPSCFLLYPFMERT